MNGTAKNSVALEDLLADEDPSKKLKGIKFEQGLALLEELVTKVESGSLPLEKAVLSYERGVQLIEQLRAVLTGAEQKLKVLQKGQE